MEKKIGSALSKQGVAQFSVSFKNGLNSLVATTSAKGATISDQAEIYFSLMGQKLNNSQLPFSELNVSLGDSRIFFDEKTGQNWLPEKAYQSGSWGYLGGKQFAMANNSRVSFGSSRNILDTDLDPIYQTQRTGIEGFVFDVPSGDYELTLHFAELISKNSNSGDNAFNLGSRGGPRDEFKARSFDVLVNEKVVISGLSNSEALQTDQAVAIKYPVSVSGSEGIRVSFKSRVGEPVLNGIQIRKLR